MKELRQRALLRLMTWITLTSCFSLLLAAVSLSTNLRRVLTLWGEEIQITAYLEKDISKDDLERLISVIKSDRRIGKWSFVDKEKALSDFRANMASYAPDLVDDDLLNLIPPSFQIGLSEEAAAKSQSSIIESLAADLRRHQGVEDVRYGQDWVERYGAIVGLAGRGTAVLGIVLLLASLFVIGNAVRAAAESRRSEVEVLELVGATRWQIRKPFVVEGAILSFSAMISSWIVVAVGFEVVRGLVQRELGFLQLAGSLSFVAPTILFALLIGGTLVGALASWLCVRRMNTGWSAASGAAE